MENTKIFGPFDSLHIRNYLPHRYPFLFVDRITQLVVPLNEKGELQQVGTIVKGIKNSSINEPFFTGHFPQLPITPGVILIETLAQVCSFAVFPWVNTDEHMHVMSEFEIRLAGVDAARFRRPVVPGDQLIIECTVKKQRGPIWAFDCKGLVDGHLALECEVLASVHTGEKK